MPAAFQTIIPGWDTLASRLDPIVGLEGQRELYKWLRDDPEGRATPPGWFILAFRGSNRDIGEPALRAVFARLLARGPDKLREETLTEALRSTIVGLGDQAMPEPLRRVLLECLVERLDARWEGAPDAGGKYQVRGRASGLTLPADPASGRPGVAGLTLEAEFDQATGKGRKRKGLRLLTVGTDCSVGKKYTALAIDREAINQVVFNGEFKPGWEQRGRELADLLTPEERRAVYFEMFDVLAN